ncbi:MAG: 5-(carboxyamino)imidazole ribonucleotide synthase [Gaiellales bacterium]|jgi:5-(carboxyamino)imidazole ribonucleotide synthase|nr:5-(carboxyamino)imidazole ribonucleotide synthase [Gaiellales bacterium]
MRVGILGGGQLARMIALAGHPLGVPCSFLDPSPEACAGPVGELVVDAYDSAAGLDRLASTCDLVTFEFESVPAAAAERLAAQVAVHPPAQALAIAQDRVHEKRVFQELGIETARFWAIDSQADLEAAALPGVLKTRRLGYDGKGQRVLRDRDDMTGAFTALGTVPLIAEQLVEFERELSIVAVRGRDGGVACYPLVENHHRDGILRVTHAPAPGLTPELQALGESHARLLLDRLDYVGVLALELFQVGDSLLANEMAPRVHNSGHWTIEGAETSQFENHLRAVCGLPLGSTELRTPSTMVNLIGGTPPLAELAAIEGAHVHLYGKAPRPGRKLGHVTVTGGREWRSVAALADAAGEG